MPSQPVLAFHSDIIVGIQQCVASKAACRQIAATADLADTSPMAIVLGVADSHDTGSQVESLSGAMRSDRSHPAINPRHLAQPTVDGALGLSSALQLSRGCYED